MRRLLPIFAVLAVSGCAAGGGSAGAGSGGACHVEQVAEMALAGHEGHLAVVGKLNQADARFVLDTGAEGSLVTPAAVQAFNLAHSRSPPQRIVGTGGTFLAPRVFANIELGGMEVRREVPAAAIPFRPREGGAYSGLIGADLLSSHDVEISVPDGRVRLWRAADCEGNYVPWGGRHWSVPLRRTTGGRLLIPVVIDGVTLSAVLDTGADATILGADAGHRLGLDAAGLAKDRMVNGTGVDGNKVQWHLHRFATFTIGPETFHDPQVFVADNNLAQGDMLLGVDWLRSRRVWISWEARKIFIQRTGDIPGR